MNTAFAHARLGLQPTKPSCGLTVATIISKPLAEAASRTVVSTTEPTALVLTAAVPLLTEQQVNECSFFVVNVLLV